MRCTYAAFFALLLSASAAQAARLTVVTGEAMLRHGYGYRDIHGSAEVSAGDTVVAKAGSTAKVTFSNGCSVVVGTGMVFNVPAEAPCEGAETSASTTAALGDSSPSQSWSAATQTIAAADAPQANMLPYLLGAVAVGGTAAAALAFSGDGGGSPPTSP